MIRTSFFAFALICLSLGHAKADNFTFTFTNQTGTVNGTVTGEIFGLVNDGALSHATAVTITTYPGPPNSFDTNLTPTTWDTALVNTFVESAGVVFEAEFIAMDTTHCPALCEFALETGLPPGATNEFLAAGQLIDRSVIDGRPLQLTNVTAPESPTVYLLSTALSLVVAIVALRRHAQGLAVGPPE